MTHDFSVEDLSAFLDGELPDERRARLAEHLSSCAACAKEMERFKKVGVSLRTHAKIPLPSGLLEKILRRLRPRREETTRLLEWGAILAVTLGAVLVVGVALKRFMPGLFSQIQTMISGAAGSLGQGR